MLPLATHGMALACWPIALPLALAWQPIVAQWHIAICSSPWHNLGMPWQPMHSRDIALVAPIQATPMHSLAWPWHAFATHGIA